MGSGRLGAGWIPRVEGEGVEAGGWEACVHALSHIGEGRLLGPRATGAGKSAECVCMSVCLCWHEQDCRFQSICSCAVTRCMHVCVCVLICRHVCVLLPVSGGKVYMYLCQYIHLFIGVYLACTCMQV